MKRVGLMILGFLWLVQSQAQTPRERDEKVIADLLERLIENTEATVDYTDLQDQLEQYNKSKLNINTVSREQLQRLFFLDDAQINAIINHRQKFGNFLTLYELQTIPALDEQTIYYLTYFVTVDEDWQQDQTRFLQMLRKGKHELIGLYDTELEKRAGYDATLKDQGKSYYMGNKERYVFRYRFNYGSRLAFGYNAETDMGERFTWNSSTKGFDFNSIHFYYRPRKGIIKTIALDDYQINFGQGLTFGSGLAARKSAFVLNVRRSYLPIRPYRSLNETEFMRGAAVMLGDKKWQVVLFGSRKYISTNYNAQDTSAPQDFFSSIDLSGLHRTPTELAKSNNVLQTIVGANAQWRFKDGYVGLTHVQTNYDIAFLSGTSLYQRYNFSGTQLGNSGIDYKYQWRNMSFFGEFSISSNQAKAFTTGVAISLDPNLDVLFLYRNFAKDYQTTYNNPFAENTDGRNEKGFYTGASLRLSRKWLLNSYVDIYSSPWLRFQVDGPSRGVDVLGELQYLPSKTAQVYFRVRHEYKTKNQAGSTEKVDYLSEQSRTVFRFNAQYKMSLNVTLKSRVETTLFSDDVSTQKTGTLIFQDVNWSAPRKQFGLIFRVAYFTVEDYNARVYAAENDVLYQYSVPMYQNSGMRYYAVMRCKITRKIELWAKWSQTVYSNVNTISSGLEQINGNTVSDVRLQLRWIL